MADDTTQTWDEMTKLYPDQWLAIVEYETDKYGEVTRGVVVGHGRDMTCLPAPPTDRGTIIALRYTGKSTFSGRICHANSNVV